MSQLKNCPKTAHKRPDGTLETATCRMWDPETVTCRCVRPGHRCSVPDIPKCPNRVGDIPKTAICNCRWQDVLEITGVSTCTAACRNTVGRSAQELREMSGVNPCASSCWRIANSEPT